MRVYTIDVASQNAINCANEKDVRGLLIPASLYDPEVHDDMDAETIYSIASLYADDDNDDGTWYDTIESKLMDLYPTYM